MSLIKSKGSFDRNCAVNVAGNMHDEQQDLARSLRRLKRRLFLEQVGAPLPASLQEAPKTMIMKATSDGSTEITYSSSPTISATSPIRAALLAAAAREESNSPSAVTAE